MKTRPRLLWLSALFSSLPVFAGQVLDLGSLEIEGKMRGPEMQWVESSQLDRRTAGNLLHESLARLESELLQPEPPTEYPAQGLLSTKPMKPQTKDSP